MLNSSSVRLFRQSLDWLGRLAVFATVFAAVCFVATVLAFRYWLLPDIEQYHDRIVASLSAAMGNPVTIGKIQGEWQGYLPHLEFTDVRVLDARGQPALVLKRIDGSLSWLTLLTAQLRLASLEIAGPELLVHRDVRGKLFVGDLAMSKQGDNNDLAGWLLRQSNVVVRDALIVWVDDTRNAPPLVLQHVDFRVDSLFSKHSFAVHAYPPSELATPLNVRGEFYGDSLDDAGHWEGQLFTRLDYTDVTAWRPWLDLPGQFSQGRGALRGWLSIRNGRVTQVIADMDLRDVVTRLGDELPELALSRLSGRASWKKLSGGFEMSTRQLALQLRDGLSFKPTDFYFRNVSADQSAGTGSGGELRANMLQLQHLASLANYLPIDEKLRSRLKTYAPRGSVSNLDVQWQGPPEKPDNYKLKGHFENIALNQVGTMPGFSGLTLDVNGNRSGGRVSVNARGLVVDAPGIMREPLSFATLTGQGGWQREDGEWSINVDNIAVANEDLAGNLYGRYRTKAGTLGVLDLTGKLTRGDIRRAARYTPLVALHKEGNDWLNGAILSGHTDDFRIRIKGNLSDFPLDGTRDVLFEIGGHARDAVMEFDKNWPRIENISGEFLINGNRLEVNAPSATILDAHLHNVSVALPDMMSKDLSLEIKGEAAGPSNAFLEFIQKSPVRGYIDHFTDSIKASGNGHLDLFARIPLSGEKPVEVSGTVKVQDNDIDLGNRLPVLRKAQGTLLFTESGIRSRDVSATVLGGKTDITIQSEANGVMHATLKGHANMDALRKSASYPVLAYLSGGTDWDADIKVARQSAHISIKSDLKGLRSDLPQPFAKRADDKLALRLEKRPVMLAPKAVGTKCTGPCPAPPETVDETRDAITAHLGEVFDAQLERAIDNGVMKISRGVVVFGPSKLPLSKRMARLPSGKSGIWLYGTVPELSVQGWEGLAGDAEQAGGNRRASTGSMPLPIARAYLHINKLTGYGQSIDALRVTATRRGDGLAAKLSSSALKGEVTWEPHGYETGSLFRAQLSTLLWSGSDKNTPSTDSAAPQENPGHPPRPQPGNLPALDISVENLRLKGKEIGRFELVGHPEGRDWRLRRLNITNPDGRLVGDGVWSDTQTQHTQVKLTLEISDAGKILGRSGYPNTVNGGSGKLDADLTWAGSPDEFAYSSLNGTLKLDTGKGRFLKMDPGAGKLLSVLSLQDLPKHIALGFKDVFSEGFQFDNISGNATIRDGVIDSQDFHIYGSSAKVSMKGNVDLKSETQNLSVRILPTLGDSVSLIGALAINPAVGIGSLIVNKVLGDPLDKLASFEYNISGSWSDPNVVKLGRVTPPPVPVNPK